jgi:hypothetical protein
MVPVTAVAVITGDVNASSKMPEQQARRLEGLLRECFREVSESLPEAHLDSFTNFRGDSWQFVVKEPLLAVRAALLFRSRLIVHSDKEMGNRLHTATAIGFGGIDYLPDGVSLAGGGAAYESSGKKLDKLHRRMPGMGVSGLGPQDPYFDRLVGVIDALVRSWTAMQAQAVAFALQGFTQVEISHLWRPPISQQAVNKHLKAAGWPAIDPALQWIETTLKGCLQENNP